MTSTSSVFTTNNVIKFIAEVSPRQIVMVISLLAYLLVFPSVNEGFFRDDFYHRAMLKGDAIVPGATPQAPLSASAAAFSLFAFFGADNDNFAQGLNAGVVPWWADKHLEIRFWRPLSALTHWLDYQLWPDSTMLMHLQSALWYTLLVFLWGHFLRNIGFRGWALVFAMVAYGLDASHIPAVAWIANRNILLAGVFGVLTLITLNKGVRDQRLPLLAASVLLFACSLLSAEAGISTAAYVASYLLFMDSRAWRIRALWLLPYGLTVILWRSIYHALGFQVQNSGAYLDPALQTGEFLHNLLVQVPILLMDQFTGLESQTLLMAPDILIKQAWIAAIILTLILASAWPLLRHNRTACFLLTGALLALIPTGSTLFTGGRLLLFAGAGIAATYGMFAAVINQEPWKSASRIYRFWVYFLVIGLSMSNLLANGILWGAQIQHQLTRDDKPAMHPMSDLVTAYDGKAEFVIAVNPPTSFELLYLQLKARYLGKPAPPMIRTLAPGASPFILTRVADNAVEIHSETGSLAISPNAEFSPTGPLQSLYYAARRVDTFFAGRSSRMRAGDQIELPGTLITVEQTTPAGVPVRVLFRFAGPLDNARYQWLYWNVRHEHFVDFTLPGIGQSVRIAGPFEP